MSEIISVFFLMFLVIWIHCPINICPVGTSLTRAQLKTERCNDMETFFQLFNEQCSSVLDIVAPFKSRQFSSVKSSPWTNESISNFRRKCRKTECLWKATKLEVHQLQFNELLICLNDMMREARTAYFANLISTSKRNACFL